MQKNVKKCNGSIIVIALLVIVIVGLIGYICYDKGVFGKKESKNNNENTNEETNEQSQKGEENDIYGYAFMELEYLPSDSSGNESYRILELHKNSEDKVLVSYDVNKKDSIDRVNGVGNLKLVNDKIYYQLYYSSEENGIFTYNNIMYIDLSSDKKEPIELLNWKQDSNNYEKTLSDFKITDDYVYFNTIGCEHYKYNIKTKELTTITETDFETIKEQQNPNDWTIDKLYLNGKELLIDDINLELIYDGKTIYKSNADDINLLYSFNGDIIINEFTFLEDFEYDIKHYKYNFSKQIMEEIDPQTNQMFTKVIWYR